MDPQYNFVYRIAASLEDEITEVDAGWFDKLSEKAKETYIRIHPQSKYARYVRRQTKMAPTDIKQIAPTKDALKQMKKHQKEIDYGAKYEKDPARRKAFQAEQKKMAQMIQKQRERIDDEYYAKKERKKEENKLRKETDRNLRKADKEDRKAQKQAPQQERVEPTFGEQPKPEAQTPPQQPRKPQQPQPRKYSPEELQRLYRGGRMASDYVPSEPGAPAPGHGPQPTKVVKKKAA